MELLSNVMSNSSTNREYLDPNVWNFYLPGPTVVNSKEGVGYNA